MTFKDLYLANSDWEKSTILGISTCSANKSEKLKAYMALMTYTGYEVVGFGLNWVVLRAPDCFSQHEEVESCYYTHTLTKNHTI